MVAIRQNRKEIIVSKSSGLAAKLQAGDFFKVVRRANGTVLLVPSPKPSRISDLKDGYLTPAPLAAAVRRRLYRKKDGTWDRVEEAAVSASREKLAGWKLDEL